MTSSPARPGETESESLDTGPVGHRLQGAVTAANVADTTMFAAVLEDVPPIRTPSGRRRTRPAAVHTDKGYDSAANRAWLRRRGITPRIARRGIESSQRLGRHRYVVERALSWLSCWRRLAVRWDRVRGAGSRSCWRRHHSHAAAAPDRRPLADTSDGYCYSMEGASTPSWG